MSFNEIEDDHSNCLLRKCKVKVECNLERYRHHKIIYLCLILNQTIIEILNNFISKIKQRLRTEKKIEEIRNNISAQWFSKFAAEIVLLTCQSNDLRKKLLVDKVFEVVFARYWLHVIKMVNFLIFDLFHEQWNQKAYLLYNAFADKKLLNMIDFRSLTLFQFSTLCSKISKSLMIFNTCKCESIS